MATVITDVFESRLLLTGVEAYAGGMKRAAGATAGLEGRLDKLNTLSARAGVAGLGIALAFGKAATAAGDEAAAMQRASIAFRSHGKSFPTEEIAAYASEMQRLTGVEDGAIAGALGLLGTFNVTKEQAKQLTPAMLDAAESLKAQGVSLESLAVGIGKALQTGQTEGLRRSGIVIDEVRAKTDLYGAVLDGVASQGKGAAVAFRQTLPGAMQATKNAAGDLQEALGAPLIVPLTQVANLATGAAVAFTNLPGPVQTSATVLGVTLAGGLGLVSAGAKVLAVQNSILMNSHLRAAGAANAHAAAEGRLAATLGISARTAGTAAVANNTGAVAGFGLGKLGGVAGKVGRGLGTSLGLGVAGMGLDYGAEALGKRTPLGAGVSVLSTAASWAALGAGLGSVIPGIGTLAGGLIGAVGGAGYGAYDALGGKQGHDAKQKPTKAESALDRIARASEAQVTLLKDLKDLNAGVGSDDVIDVMGEARVLRLLAGKMAG